MVAEQGEAEAQFDLGARYVVDRDVVSKNWPVGWQMLLRAREDGNDDAARLLKTFEPLRTICFNACGR